MLSLPGMRYPYANNLSNLNDVVPCMLCYMIYRVLSLHV